MVETNNDTMDKITKLEIEIYKLEMKMKKEENKITLNILIDEIFKKYDV